MSRKFNPQLANEEAPSSSDDSESPPTDRSSGTQILTTTKSSGLAQTWFLAQLVPQSLDISLEAKALNFFSWAYGIGPIDISTPNIPGYFACFEALYPKAGEGSFLQVTGEAVSLAALGEQIRDQSIVRKSQQQYVKALRLARETLSPSEPPSNPSILAILLLGLYEQIVCPSSSLLGWSAHIRGAQELARLRTDVDSNDLISRKLYAAIQNQNVIGIIQSDRLQNQAAMPIPVDYLQLDTPVRPLVSYFSEILILRKTIIPWLEINDTAPPIDSLREALAEAERLWGKVESWPVRLESQVPCYTYRIRYNSSAVPPIAAGIDTWTVYPAPWASVAWNAYRIAKILLLVTRQELGSLSRVWYGDISEVSMKSYEESIAKTSRDILSAVPPILFPGIMSQYSSREGGGIIDLTSTAQFSSHDRIKGGHALALLWPLHFVASEPTMCPAHKEQAKEILRYIGNNVGLKIASVLGAAYTYIPDVALPILSSPS